MSEAKRFQFLEQLREVTQERDLAHDPSKRPNLDAHSIDGQHCVTCRVNHKPSECPNRWEPLPSVDK